MASKTKNKFKDQEPQGSIPNTVSMAQAQAAAEQLRESEEQNDFDETEEPLNDERALVALAEGVELPERGIYAVTFSDEGEIVAINPMPAVAVGRNEKDIVVLCPTSGRKCVAEFEVKRKVSGEVRLVCKECVGPQRDNDYQRML